MQGHHHRDLRGKCAERLENSRQARRIIGILGAVHRGEHVVAFLELQAVQHECCAPRDFHELQRGVVHHVAGAVLARRDSLAAQVFHRRIRRRE